jgi:hypothetical protein
MLLNLSIEPFACDIKYANDNSLYISAFNYADKDTNVVVKISKKDFNDICQKWIERKTKYCTDYGHPCGVLGCFDIVKYEHTNEVFKERGIDYIVIEPTAIGECDMEHG